MDDDGNLRNIWDFGLVDRDVINIVLVFGDNFSDMI